MWFFKHSLSLYILAFPLIGFDVSRFDLTLAHQPLAYHLGTRVSERRAEVVPHVVMLSAFASRPYQMFDRR